MKFEFLETCIGKYLQFCSDFDEFSQNAMLFNDFPFRFKIMLHQSLCIQYFLQPVGAWLVCFGRRVFKPLLSMFGFWHLQAIPRHGIESAI